MNNIESPKIIKNLFVVSSLFAAGFVSLNTAEKISENIYNSKKNDLERKFESLINKKVKLGNYGGLSLLGFSLNNSEILDKELDGGHIKSNKIFIRFMPFRSFLSRKWIFNITTNKLDLKLKKDFFKLENNKQNDISNNNQLNYEIYFQIKNRSNLFIDDLGLSSKIKGNIVYKSSENYLIGSFNTFLKDRGKLDFKIKKKFNNDLFKLKIISKGAHLKSLNFNFLNKQINFSDGFLRSNLTFYKSKNNNYCKGKFSLYDFKIISDSLNEDIETKSLKFNCSDNKLISNINKLNYGTLTSRLNLDIPLNDNINDIKIEGEIGYVNSINPEIKISGNIPYWYQRDGIKFGVLNTKFNLNRTQLSNLNVFRKSGIRGFITAKGKLSGGLDDLKTKINFNLDYPHFKGIRIRETWDGNIINSRDGYLLNLNNRYSPIPSFLSLKFDSSLKLKDLEFSRIFDSNKGYFSISRNDEMYEWKTNNFPLNELELSLQNNKFDRIEGTINGSGRISLDQSINNGRFSLSLGKYRNIKFANSLFDFKFKDNSLNINSSLYPIDGGMIDVVYRSDENNKFKINFINISKSWTSLTLYDVFNFNKDKTISNGNSKDLKSIEIINNQKTIDEQLASLKQSIISKEISINKKRIYRFLDKFEGRYNANLDIYGDKISNYEIKTNLQAYLKEKNEISNPIKNNFTIDLSGGLFRNNGILKIKNLPLNLANLFFQIPKDFKGNLDINLLYNLNEKSFSSIVSSNKTSINNLGVKFQKGLISFIDSKFKLDLSLLLDDSSNEIRLLGLIPKDKNDELDLRLKGDQKFLELIGNLFNKNFSFINGDANLRMIIKGIKDKPIANGFLFIKNAEVEILKNKLKNLDATMIFDFDQIEIKNFKALSDNQGKISLVGTLPFYKELDENQSINFSSENFQLKGSNIDFGFDSNIFIKGSFIRPIISGNIWLKNGLIDLKNNSGNDNNSSRLDAKNKTPKSIKRNSWPELYWSRDKEIEIISNESILNKNLFEENLPEFLGNINFDNLYIQLGPDFRIEYAPILKAYLQTRINININGNVSDNLNARGLVDIKKGTANLYTTPFKLDKNQDNYILFASRNGITPYLDFSLISKVPDTIIPITQNNKDINSSDYNNSDQASLFGAFGIGNTRLIKIEASYKGFLDQLSFEDKNQMIQLRSTPNYTRSQIIGLIGGNSSNLINRAFISQFNGTEGFNEKLQLSLYPALIENADSVKNIFSSDNLEINENETVNNGGFSSQAWIAEIGLDITDDLNFAMQTTPDRDDIPPLWILTLQANEFLEILGSFDSEGDWKSQVQLFFRY